MRRKNPLDKDTINQILAAIQLLSNVQSFLSEFDFPTADGETAPQISPPVEQQTHAKTPEQFFNDEFFSLSEAHKRFGYPRAALYEFAKSNKLRTILIGKRKRMTTRAWLDDCFMRRASEV